MTYVRCLLVFAPWFLRISPSASFSTPSAFDRQSGRRSAHDCRGLGAKGRGDQRGVDDEDDDEVRQVNPLTKASWFAVEAFGKAFGSNKSGSATAGTAISLDKPPASIDETLQRIRADNEREYFLSGRVDELIYDEDCVFADPFVSFRGRDRFVENLKNLGSFITEYSARPLQYEVEEGNGAVETKFMVKLRLNLPWEPVLAWPWGVRCEIDPETNLVVLHRESWDVEPLEVSGMMRSPLEMRWCFWFIVFTEQSDLMPSISSRLISSRLVSSRLIFKKGSKANLSQAYSGYQK